MVKCYGGGLFAATVFAALLFAHEAIQTNFEIPAVTLFLGVLKKKNRKSVKSRFPAVLASVDQAPVE